MSKIRIIAIMPWGDSTCFVESNQVEKTRIEYEAQGAEKVYVGAEAEQYQATAAEIDAIQAIADRDWLGPDA